jgi:hypothetical protein
VAEVQGQHNYLVLDNDGNAVKIKADRFFYDQGAVFFQSRDETGGLDEVAMVSPHHIVFNENNIVQE